MRKFLVALCVGLFASTTRVDVECRAIRGNPEVCNRTPGCGFREVYFFRHPERVDPALDPRLHFEPLDPRLEGCFPRKELLPKRVRLISLTRP